MQWFNWVIAIVLSAGAGYWVYRADARRAVPYPWLTAALRAIVIFIVLLLLLVPRITISRNETRKPSILLLQDDSRSIANALGADSAAYRKSMQALMERLSSKYNVIQWAFGGHTQADSLFQYRQPVTDISNALLKAQEYFEGQNLGGIILASDGRFNTGANPLYQPLAFQGSLYTVAIGDSAQQKDIRITQTYANRTVSLNSQFEIRADLVAILCNGYNNSIQLLENGEAIGTASINVNSNRYDRSVAFTVKATKAGLHHYVVSAPAAEGEQNIANNRRDVFVEVVDEKKNILILSAAPHPDVNAIKEALASVETYKVTVKTEDNMPASFSDYQVIILHGLPSQMANIAQRITAAKKPVWYILTATSSAPQINELQKAVKLTPAMPHDVLAVYSTSFNAFTLPQNMQAVFDRMPPLVVSEANVQTLGNTAVLFTQKGGSMPLWALQQGSTPTAVLAGEGLWRWRLYEYKNFNDHNVVDECIRQTVAFLSANSSERPFRVVLPKYVWSDQEPINMNGYLLNANNEQVNEPEAQLTITDSANHKQNYTFERSGNAYSLNVGLWAAGTYNYSAHVNYNGKTLSSDGSFTVESVPLELMETGADYPLLYGLANKYNGALVPAKNVSALYDSITNNPRIKPIIQTTTESLPLIDRKWLFFLVLLFAVAEWLLRKYWLAQ
jgi:hypothetical protein